MKLENIKTIYFDFDGTIHDSIKIYAPAFRKGYQFLVDNNKAYQREWKDGEIKKWLGYSVKDMWENFMKDLEGKYKKEAGAIISEEMNSQMALGNARLFDNSERVLMELKRRGCKLVFLSNCRIDYLEVSRKTFNLDLYFEDMICCEAYDFIPKHEILKQVKGNYKNNQVMVGDRFHDIDAAVKNGIQSVYCEYGYGKRKEGEGATVHIKDISEILEIL